MNVYPIGFNLLKSKLNDFLTDINKLRKYPSSKKGASYNKKVKDLISILSNGVDIKTPSESAIKKHEKTFGVKELDPEILLYQDNCLPDEPDSEGRKGIYKIIKKKRLEILIDIHKNKYIPCFPQFKC